MAHPLSALFDVPHGVACAMLLPTVMRFNMPAAKEKYVEIAKACGVYEIGMNTDEAAEAACKAIEEPSAKVGTNKRLTDLGIKESDISALAEQAINDVCTPGNPRSVTKQDIIDLYHQIL
jgi:lactaldehyde reductase